MPQLPLVLLLLSLTRAASSGTETLQFEATEGGEQPQELGQLVDRLAATTAARVRGWRRRQFGLYNLRPPAAPLTVGADGRLRAAAPLLRERLCPTLAGFKCSEEARRDKCELTASLRISNAAGAFVLVDVRVSVLDVDNSPPRFPRRRVDLQVAETAAVGFELPLAAAEDADSRGFASCRLRYDLIACPPDLQLDAAFSLHQSQDRPPTLALVLARPLDREAVRSVRYCLTAADSRGSGAVATATIVVRVRDANDNSPVWAPGHNFTVSVREAANPDVLLQLRATDADSEFGRVQYRLLKDHRLFFVNSRGQLKLQTLNGLDFETQRRHVLQVAAVDNGDPPRSATATVTVNVLDSNDNAPSFEDTDQYKTIVENNKPETFVQSVTVVDLDDGSNAALACGLVAAHGSFRLRLEQNQTGLAVYSLLANASFDREQRDRYDVGIECWDAGSPPRRSRKTVHVTIGDTNDNPPVFEVSPIDFSVREDKPKGSRLYTVRVVDLDWDSHSPSKRKFELSGEGSEQFEVKFNGGDSYSLMSVGEFDRETKAAYNLSLVVLDLDSGSVLHSAATRVLVKVQDVNDCAPEFSAASRHASFSVLENATVGTVVGTVAASDRDEGRNARLSYRLRQRGRRQFLVDAASGRIRLALPLERDGPDGVAQHRLQLLAVDAGLPRRTATATVVVDVVDCNDNRPRFRSPAAAVVNVSCDQSQPNHFLQVDVLAVDADATADFSRLQYRLVQQLPLTGLRPDGAPYHTFDVDKDSGQVFVRTAPPLCRHAVYRLKLEVFEPQYHRDVSRKDFVVSFEGGDRQPGRPVGRRGDSGDGDGLGDSETPQDDVEQVVVAVLIVASVVLVALILLLLGLFWRSRLSTPAAYEKGRRIQTKQQPSISLPLTHGCAAAAGQTGAKMWDGVNQADLCASVQQQQQQQHSRYDSLYRQRRRNASLDEDDDCLESADQPMQLHTSLSQQLPQERHRYQAMLPGNQLSSSEGYMTCQFPGERALPQSRSCSKMIDSKKRPSEPSPLKSPYFTVSHV